MVLLLDNYDSFTHILCDYILQCGKACTVVRNNEKSIDDLLQMPFESVVISPGPKTPQQAGITMQIIERLHTTKPILGVCLGHQALGTFFGMKLVEAATPMHGKASEIEVDNSHCLFKNMPQKFSVMRYHSLLLEGETPPELKITAQTAKGEIMALAHTTLPLAGVQFHPESVLTEHGLQMLQNWFQFTSAFE